jgi:putative transcriptional regulator
MSDNKTSRIIEEMFTTAQGMQRCGLIDKRRFAEHQALYAACRTPQYTGEEVKELRTRLQVSQAVLAALMNTSVAAVRAWEAGTKKPGGQSNKLLQLLDTKGLEVFL